MDRSPPGAAPSCARRDTVPASGHTLELERGSVQAEVVPRAPAEGLVEAFAVEVGQTRVAVHGTSFTVTRLADGVLVDVEHGAVAIGPTSHHGDTTGHLLVGPSRAIFSTRGGSVARFVPRTSEPAAPVLAMEAPTPEGAPSIVGSGARRAAQEVDGTDDVPQEFPPAAANRSLRTITAAHVEEPAPPPPAVIDPPSELATPASVAAKIAWMLQGGLRRGQTA